MIYNRSLRAYNILDDPQEDNKSLEENDIILGYIYIVELHIQLQ